MEIHQFDTLNTQLRNLQSSVIGLHRRERGTQPMASARFIEAVTKAVTNPARTDVAGWAQELTGPNFLSFLASGPQALLVAQLAEIGLKVDLTGWQSAKIPYSTDLASHGAWIGEALPIPLGSGVLAAASMSPFKCACVISYTAELAKRSFAQQIIQQVTLLSLQRLIDGQFVSNNAGNSVTPAGILSGLTPIAAATAGAGAMSSDLKTLAAAIIAKGGTGLAILTNPVTAISFAFLAQTPGIPILTSTSIPAGRVIGVDPSSAAIYIGPPDLDASHETTIHEETAAAPIVDAAGVVAKPVRSMWQTDSLAERLIFDTSWTIVGGRAAYIDSVNWA